MDSATRNQVDGHIFNASALTREAEHALSGGHRESANMLAYGHAIAAASLAHSTAALAIIAADNIQGDD